jgi:hypothetical protein
MARTIIALAALALAVTLPAVSAQAQAPRTFVSAAGSDSNPCSFAAPCRHFQAAVNATSAGGEVDALDPAGYGPIVITQAVTIEGQGWSYIAPPAGGNGITINAGSGNVVIHGVSLNGAGITGNTNGIVFNSGAGLTVTDCVAQNFAGFGIFLQAPLSKVLILNSISSDNAGTGVGTDLNVNSSGMKITLDKVTTNNNGSGVILNSHSTQSDILVSVIESTSSNNINFGYQIAGLGYLLTLDHVAMLGNSIGASASHGTIVVGDSRARNQSFDMECVSGGSISTFGDNRLTSVNPASTACTTSLSRF